jgi:hypothetical protein
MKKFSFGRITFLFVLTITSIVVFFACQREIRRNKIDPIRQAKIWFHRTYDAQLRIDASGKIINGYKYPDWRFITS